MPHPVYSHLTYIVHLFCLGKLSRPKYQWKLKSWKFYSKMCFWLKNLYLLKQYNEQRLFGELPDKGWKLGSIDSLLKIICKTGTIVLQAGSGGPRSVHSSGEPCAQSGGQARKASISSWDFVWNCHSAFKCAQDNSPFRDLQLKCFKRRRAQLMFEANRISRLTRW